MKIKDFTNPKYRMSIIATVTLVSFGLFIIYNNLTAEETNVVGGSRVVAPNNIRSIPGAQTSEYYQKQQTIAEQKKVEEAKKQNKSNVPTIISNIEKKPDVVGGFLDKNRKQLDAANQRLIDARLELERANEERNQRNLERLKKLEEDREKALLQDRLKREKLKAEEAYNKAVIERAKVMERELNKYAPIWSSVPTQSFVRGELAVNSGAVGVNPQNFGMNSSDTTLKSDPDKLIPAGTILYATLLTGVNTDEKSTVIAEINTGNLKGAKIIGTIAETNNQFADKAILQFSAITLNGEKRSMAINAVAIDLKTARTAIASSVDYHYLTKYSALFASSFIQGYADAISQSGKETTENTSTGDKTIKNESLSPNDKFYVALGEVGKAWSEQIKPYAQRPRTITVDAGTGLGLLFTKDADLT